MATATAPTSPKSAEESWPTAEELDAILKLVGQAADEMSKLDVRLVRFLTEPSRPRPTLEDLGALTHFVTTLEFEARCIRSGLDAGREAIKIGSAAWELQRAS